MFEYVSVTGGTHDIAREYFHNYLISIGEPTTSRRWDLASVTKHVKRILKEHKKIAGDHNIFLDSGGYQIITNDIKLPRYKEFIHVYHFILEKFKNEFDYIFSLDINWPGKLSADQLYDFNKMSIEESIKVLKKYPELVDKQLFVWQTRNPFVYDTWNRLFDELDIKDTYTKWAFGGLVGFKTVSGAKFSPFVPSFLDFMVKREKYNLTVKHVHFLGQSSMLAVFTAALLKKLFSVEDITLDSSELVRVTPLKQKLPVFYNGGWLRTEEELNLILDEEEYLHLLETGRLHNNDTFIKTMSVHIDSLFKFAESNIEQIYNDIVSMDAEKFLDKWDILNKGRFYNEFKRNIEIIHEWLPIIEVGDTDKSSSKYRDEILGGYKSF